MSLILDALRKSEAERQRGQAPSLYSAMPVPSTPRAPAWLRLLPVVLGALLLLAAGWFALRKAAEPAATTPMPAQLEDAAQADMAADATASAPGGAGLENAPAAAAAAASATPPGAAAPPKPTPTTTPAAATAPRAAGVDVATPAPSAAGAPANAPAIAADAAPATLPREPEAAGAEPADALPPVAVLDAGTRSALPPMKLSMHVYNADPARRFAIIDGQRVIEGAQLGAASVVEIRRDGVVLDVNGRRVLLPRP